MLNLKMICSTQWLPLVPEVTSDADGNRTGVSPIIWDSWETTGVNVDQELDVNISTNQIGSDSDTDNDTNTSGNTTSTTTTTTTTTEFETEVSVGSEITTTLINREQANRSQSTRQHKPSPLVNLLLIEKSFTS